MICWTSLTLERTYTLMSDQSDIESDCAYYVGLVQHNAFCGPDCWTVPKIGLGPSTGSTGLFSPTQLRVVGSIAVQSDIAILMSGRTGPV